MKPLILKILNSLLMTIIFTALNACNVSPVKVTPIQPPVTSIAVPTPNSNSEKNKIGTAVSKIYFSLISTDLEGTPAQAIGVSYLEIDAHTTTPFTYHFEIPTLEFNAKAFSVTKNGFLFSTTSGINSFDTRTRKIKIEPNTTPSIHWITRTSSSSPDKRSILSTETQDSETQLKIVDASTGEIKSIFPVSELSEAKWKSNHEIIFLGNAAEGYGIYLYDTQKNHFTFLASLHLSEMQKMQKHIVCPQFLPSQDLYFSDFINRKFSIFKASNQKVTLFAESPDENTGLICPQVLPAEASGE